MTINTVFTEFSMFMGERASRFKPDLLKHAGSTPDLSTAPPDIVLWPETTHEVSRILKLCHHAELPVIAFGTGSSVLGQTAAPFGGVCLNMSLMKDIISTDPGNMVTQVQSGVLREDLNHALRPLGLFFPIDPCTNATLGGMAAKRALGISSARYGSMRDTVLGLEVVLADGRIIKTGAQTRRSASGYDMTALFLGSEGTLGIITCLTLKIHHMPQEIYTGICAFKTSQSAIETVQQAVQMAIPMARLEFIDEQTARAFNTYAGITISPCPHLLVEFHGSPTDVSDAQVRFVDIAKDFGALHFHHAARIEDRNALWKIRQHAYEAVHAIHPNTRTIMFDICVPMSKLAQALCEAQEALEDSDLNGAMFGHIGEGSFNTILFVDPEDETALQKATALQNLICERALELDGSLSASLGIGLQKLHLMKQEHGVAWELMGDIKYAMDPKKILNPGKIIPPQKPRLIH